MALQQTQHRARKHNRVLNSRGVQAIDSSVVTDSIRGVPEMVTPVIDSLCCQFITQISLQLVLGCTV